MDAGVLEQGLRNHLPAIEGFLKTILLKKINVEISATSLADSEMVIEALKTGTAVISTSDQIFGVNAYIAFDDNWIPQLSTAMLGVEEQEINEITRDLIKEFSAQLFGTMQVSLQNEEIPVEPGEVEILKSAQISNSVVGQEYFIAQVDVSGKFEIEGDEQPELAMIVAFEVPDQDIINEVMGDGEVESTPAPQAEPEMEATEPVETDASDDDSGMASDEDIESMFSDSPEPAQAAAPTQAPPPQQAAPKKPKEDVDRQKAKEQAAIAGRTVEFDDFNPFSDVKSDVEVRNLDILKDVELNISVELGRKDLPLGDVLHLVRGSVIELDKLAGEPVEIYANSHRIAEGEVVVIDEHFGVRITNLVSTKERIESLR